MNNINTRKLIFYVLSLHMILIFPYQSCAPLSSITGEIVETTDQSSLGFSKTCEATQNPEYRASLLTKTEVAYVLSDLFPSETAANAAILAKVKDLPEIAVARVNDNTIYSENNSGAMNSEVYVLQLLEVAQLLFDQYAAHPNFNSQCVAAADTCLSNFVDKFVPKLWRRPLIAQERTLFTDIFKRAISVQEKLNLSYLVALSAPQFFYKNYLTKSGNPDVSYSQYALASRISFFLYNSVPDSLLLQDAAAGKLSSPAVVESHVDRLLSKEPYLSRFVKHTLAPWLSIEDDLNSELMVKNDKGVSVALKDLAQQQYQQLYDIVKMDKNISHAFFSDAVFMNKSIASYLGLDASRYATTLQKADLIPGKLESGYLTSPHFAYSTASDDSDETLVTHRGIYIAKKLLCVTIPVNELDPDAVNLVLGPNATTMNQIEISNIRRNHASCMGCHKEIDKVGMGAEFVDSFGRVRKSYSSGKPINVNFKITQSQYEAVTDLPSFLKSVAHDSRLQSCFVKSAVSKVAPMHLDSPNACASEVAERSRNLGIRSYIKELVNSKFFTQARSI